ncbi:hypothetical protein [Streptococcus equi]
MTVPTGYQSQVEGDSGAGFTITNTYTPEMISITGQKPGRQGKPRRQAS